MSLAIALAFTFGVLCGAAVAFGFAALMHADRLDEQEGAQ